MKTSPAGEPALKMRGAVAVIVAPSTVVLKEVDPAVVDVTVKVVTPLASETP